MPKRNDRTYYELSLSAGQLTAALVAIAALVLAAFVLGYAAAWAVRAPTVQRTASGAAPAVGLPAAGPTATPTPSRVVGAPAVPSPTPTPTPLRASRPSAPPAAPPTPRPQAAAPPTPHPAPTRAAVPGAPVRYWVQVLASRSPATVRRQQRRLAKLGFPPDHQRVVRVRTASGNILLKLRVGPFPDANSAERVKRRMRAAGYDDAWVVRP